MTFDTSSDTAPISTAPLGLPLLAYIQEDPLGAASRFQSRFGDVARLNILFRRIYYFFSPEAARQILVDHQGDFTREARLLRIFESFQGKNVLTTEGPDWERQRRILTPGFSPKRISGYMELMRAAIDDSVGEELPAEPGRSKTIDVDSLTTRITMDVILRTLFSHATTTAEASKVSTAIRALTRQSMREVFWAFIPPRWLPYPGRAAKLELDTDADGAADLVVQLGPVIKGTALRDAADFIVFTDFRDQIEFAKLARSLNDEAHKALALPEGDLTGKTMTFEGALTLRSASDAMALVPTLLKEVP